LPAAGASKTIGVCMDKIVRGISYWSKFVLAGLGGGLWAAALPVGSIVKVAGFPKVVVYDLQQHARQVQGRAPVYEGDEVLTAKSQSLVLNLKESNEVILGPNSRLRIEHYAESETQQITLGLVYGILRTWVMQPYKGNDGLKLKTEQGIVGVRGTRFFVESLEKTDKTTLHTFDGRVAFAKNEQLLNSPAQSVTVQMNEFSSIDKFMQKPALPQPFDPEKFRKDLKTKYPQFDALLSESRPRTTRSQNTEEKGPLFPSGLKKKNSKR